MNNFPILQGGGITISWSVAEQAYLGYIKKYGTSQSMETIAKRGGFGVEELDEFHPQWRDHIKLKHDLNLLSEQAASMSNTLADYARKMNSLAHYIIDNEHSTDDAKDYANEVLDFIIPYLETK